jgi:uncharacterized protein DUF4157
MSKSDRHVQGVHLHSGGIARAATSLFGAQAFVVGRHVFLSRRAFRHVHAESPEGRELLAHELAHVEQYRRRGVVAFLTRYFSEYVVARVHGRTHREAYESIGFEREARERARTFAASSASSEAPTA